MDTGPAMHEGDQPPARPVVPPMPSRSPGGAVPPLAAWLRMPRPEAEPGIWRCGHQPRSAEEPDRTPTRQLVVGALVSFLIAWLLWSLLYNGYLGSYWLWPLLVLTPDSWRGEMGFVVAAWAYYGIVIVGLAVVFGRMGHWGEVARRAWSAVRRLANGPAATAGMIPAPRTPEPHEDPAQWPELRAAGAAAAADRLAAELHAGRMTDVDQARIAAAWRRAGPYGVQEFAREVLAHGAAAFRHGSGARDLPGRAARHDLVVRQVRIGTAVDGERVPPAYRGAGIALEPALLGTSALVVGPSGSGKTTRLVRPVVEALCLQALTGQAAIVAVTSAGGRLAADDYFDVVLSTAAGGTHGLDLYGGAADPDEAGEVLAEALAGDLTASLPGGDTRRAALVLAQLCGPYAAVHGHFPGVPALRDLLDGGAALEELRAALDGPQHSAQLRELDAYARQVSRGDVVPLLADRVALLDRPAFAGLFATEGTGRRVFSLRALDRPVRVRVDLPERGHAEASRILARLVLAQFLESVTARTDPAVFAGLVLDDAAQTVSPHLLQGLQRLRSANAGVLLTLRTLGEVPEALRGPLVGAVGCRVVCAGISPWDGEHVAQAWGTEWVETRSVTNRQLVSDEPMTRLVHGIRRMVTGRYVTAEAVTVRREQRQRWSPSDLANELPAGHAVLSVTTVRGQRTAPVLTQLEG